MAISVTDSMIPTEGEGGESGDIVKPMLYLMLEPVVSVPVRDLGYPDVEKASEMLTAPD